MWGERLEALLCLLVGLPERGDLKRKIQHEWSFWNCRGAGKKGMTTCFSDIIKDHSLDFLGIQETKKKNFDPKYLRRVDPFDRFSWNFIPSVGKSGGILCGVKKETLEVVSWIAGNYLLQVAVFDVRLKCVWTLVVVYGAAHDDKKDEFLAELALMCSNISTPYVIGGRLQYPSREL
jgi:hypothetical protein